MAIENRNLEAGTRLMANYKKARYVCTVEPEGDGLAFVLEDGRRFKSPSAAGSAVMGGKAVNGWRFWSLEAEAASPNVAAESAKPTAKAAKASTSKKLLYRLPNQRGVTEGSTRFWCNACMKSFTAEGSETPESCPAGHRADDAELTAPVGAGGAAVE